MKTIINKLMFKYGDYRNGVINIVDENDIPVFSMGVYPNVNGISIVFNNPLEIEGDYNIKSDVINDIEIDCHKIKQEDKESKEENKER